jgi:hypothetical protein
MIRQHICTLLQSRDERLEHPIVLLNAVARLENGAVVSRSVRYRRFKKR